MVWPESSWALREARVAPGKYKCADCQGHFPIYDVCRDHIDPVVSIEAGFVDWNTYIDRLFVLKDNYQILCKGCHDVKTWLENELRQQCKLDDQPYICSDHGLENCPCPGCN